MSDTVLIVVMNNKQRSPVGAGDSTRVRPLGGLPIMRSSCPRKTGRTMVTLRRIRRRNDRTVCHPTCHRGSSASLRWLGYTRGVSRGKSPRVPPQIMAACVVETKPGANKLVVVLPCCHLGLIRGHHRGGGAQGSLRGSATTSWKSHHVGRKPWSTSSSCMPCRGDTLVVCSRANADQRVSSDTFCLRGKKGRCFRTSSGSYTVAAQGVPRRRVTDLRTTSPICARTRKSSSTSSI